VSYAGLAKLGYVTDAGIAHAIPVAVAKALIRCPALRLTRFQRRHLVRTGFDVPSGVVTVACTQTQPRAVESMFP
jgi:hypothetical protein